MRGFEECLTGFESFFAEVPQSVAVLDDSSLLWGGESSTDEWPVKMTKSFFSAPSEIPDMYSVMQQCIKLHGLEQPTVDAATLDFVTDGAIWDSSSDIDGSMSDGLLSDTMDSEDECDSAEEFAEMFSKDLAKSTVVPVPVQTFPVTTTETVTPPPKRPASSRVRRPSRRLADAEESMTHQTKRSSSSTSIPRMRPGNVLKVRRGGIRKGTDQARISAAVRSREEMQQVIKQFGATSTESRRRQHNVLERKRRCDLKSSYQDLRGLIPTLQNMERVPTGQILLGAIGYIRELQQEDKELEIRLMQMRDENKRLKRFVRGK